VSITSMGDKDPSRYGDKLWDDVLVFAITYGPCSAAPCCRQCTIRFAAAALAITCPSWRELQSRRVGHCL